MTGHNIHLPRSYQGTTIQIVQPNPLLLLSSNSFFPPNNNSSITELHAVVAVTDAHNESMIHIESAAFDESMIHIESAAAISAAFDESLISSESAAAITAAFDQSMIPSESAAFDESLIQAESDNMSDIAYNVAYVRGMRGIFQNGGQFENIQTLIFVLLIRPYN